MKKLNLLFLGAMALCVCDATAQESVAEYVSFQGQYVKSVSPNGKYVVGSKSAYGSDLFSSFVWDSSTKTNVLTTSYSDADLTTCGLFNYVNDNGVVVGSSKSDDFKVDVPASDWNDAYTVYFANATVWENGKVTRLGIGNHTTDEFTDEMDGSYATAVSADGKTVVGYIYKSYMPYVPCGWQYSDDTQKYEYFEFTTPDPSAIGQISAMSTDATVMAGFVNYDHLKRPVVWTSPYNCREINLGVATDKSNGGEAVAVSPNGKYVLIYVLQHGNPLVAVYDVQTGESKVINHKMALVDLKALAVDDNGNFFVKCMDTDYNEATYYYSNASKTFVSMPYFMQTYAPDMQYADITSASVPAAMSADGTRIVGMTSGSGWYLQITQGATLVERVKNVNAFATGKDKFAVTWDAVESLADGITLKQYDVYVNDDLYSSVSAADAAGKAQLRLDAAAAAGNTYDIYVKVVCEKAGKEITSDASEEVSVAMPDSYDLPLFDDFESQSFSANGWTRELAKGNVSEIIQWNISGGSAYDFENSTYFANFTTISDAPFEGRLKSRFIDATDASGLFLAFSGNLTYVNTVPTILDNDALDIEYTLDGENWTKLYTLGAKDITPYVWNFYKYDLSALDGKVFQLRFNVHGLGESQLRWSVDQVSVNNDLDNAPSGMLALKKEGGVELTWKNNFDAYEVSYLGNSNVIPCYNIGNEGNPLIAAIELPEEKLADYVGKYITSVTSFIYDDPSMTSVKHTQAEAIVYADGVEVSRAPFSKSAYNNPYSDVAPLTAPVLVEAGKTYRIACRISNYDPQQSPLYYQANTDCVPFVTDLYSEDEGETWHSVYEFNENNSDPDRAYCVWPLRANITDAADAASDADIDNTLQAYNVFRNGVQLNQKPIYAAYKKYVDKEAGDNDKYAVMAFYNDGRVSAISEEASITVSTAISSTFAEGAPKLTVDTDAKTIRIEGDFDSVSVVNANGQTVAATSASAISTSGLAKGVYVVTVGKGDKKATYKLAVK